MCRANHACGFGCADAGAAPPTSDAHREPASGGGAAVSDVRREPAAVPRPSQSTVEAERLVAVDEEVVAAAVVAVAVVVVAGPRLLMLAVAAGVDAAALMELAPCTELNVKSGGVSGAPRAETEIACCCCCSCWSVMGA